MDMVSCLLMLLTLFLCDCFHSNICYYRLIAVFILFVPFILNFTHSSIFYLIYFFACIYSFFHSFICSFLFFLDGNIPYCFVKYDSPEYYEQNFYFLPILICVCIGALAMFISIAQILKTISTDTNKAPFFIKVLSKVKVLKTSLLWVLLFLILWVTVFVYQFTVQADKELGISFLAWIACTFVNYDKNDPYAWQQVCGKQPLHHLSMPFLAWVTLTTSGVYVWSF